MRRALKLDSSNVEVFEALAPLLAREGEWEELLGILAQRRDLADDPERRLALGFEMGEVCKEHLQDLSRAAIHFEECLKIDPDHTGTLEELADIRYAEKAWDQAGVLYERLGERGLGSSRFVVAFRRGEIAEIQSDAERAIGHYQRSLELNDTFIPSRQNLIKPVWSGRPLGDRRGVHGRPVGPSGLRGFKRGHVGGDPVLDGRRRPRPGLHPRPDHAAQPG